MLTLIMNAIPQIIAALILLVIGFVIAKFIGTILESTLQGIGTDAVVHKWGIVPADKSASGIIATLVKIAIMLFFGIMAARQLNFPEVTAILNQILALGGKVFFGGALAAALAYGLGGREAAARSLQKLENKQAIPAPAAPPAHAGPENPLS